MINDRINSDYIDDFVHGYVVRQQLEDRRREADEHRLLRQYLAAHPERRLAARTARVLRTIADRLAPEQAPGLTTLRSASGGN